MNKLAIVLALSFSALLAGPAGAQAPTSLTITEWEVPWANTRPRDPYVAPDGSIWFVGQTGHYVARFDPQTAEFKRFALDDGAGPHNLIVDNSGTIWYAGNRQAHIGKLNPVSGEIQKFATPADQLRDPHTLVFDRAGNIWFTAQGGGHIGLLDVKTGAVRVATVPTENARPYGIVVDATGRPWFNEFGTNKIGVVDPATLAVREYTLPNALVVDDKDRLWFVETGIRPNQFVGFDTKSRRFLGTTVIKSGGGAVRHMVFHAPTRSIWFGTDAGTIGRAVVPQ